MTQPDQTTLRHAAAYAAAYRSNPSRLQPTASTAELRRRFCVALPDQPRPGTAVIDDLIAAAEPGLVGNTDPRFYAWVMGSSDSTGVAADWLTSVWGQNAAIFQTSPAAAVAEEAVAGWLVHLLDLPAQAGVGFVTGATMAGFVGLAAARAAVLSRAGHDFDAMGLQGAPLVRVFLSEDAHVSNLAALRFLGFGTANLVRIPADGQGVMRPAALRSALQQHDGPRIIIGQAGHINSGGFDDFDHLADLAADHDAWLHVDGAFGLWARVLPEKSALTKGLERADSWAVDGHKWLQVPYDSGFAIVKDTDAMHRAMDISASYLNQSELDGRNPTQHNPELSRRARGFAAWAVMQSLGINGIRSMIREHCAAAAELADTLSAYRGVRIVNRVDLNQVIVAFDQVAEPDKSADVVHRIAAHLNACGLGFFRTTHWQGQDVLRVSIISQQTSRQEVRRLAEIIGNLAAEMQPTASAGHQPA